MKDVRNSLKMFIWMTFLTGIVYPLMITGIAQLTMRHKANGEFFFINGKIVGAKLIAQKFENPRYFWPRPSVIDYNPLSSGGSNLSPTSSILKKVVEKRMEKVQGANDQVSVPVELLFASGSGLDPHISLEAARFQIDRIAKARGWDEKDKKKLNNLIETQSEGRYFGFLGEPCVNVLKLNLALESALVSKEV